MTMLLFTVFASFWLEVFLKVGVLRQGRRLIYSIIPIALVFLGWDSYAISRHQWHFDRSQILKVYGPLNIPLEEYLFFIVVPIAAIMTLEAVRKRRPHWVIGDEATGRKK